MKKFFMRILEPSIIAVLAGMAALWGSIQEIAKGVFG